MSQNPRIHAVKSEHKGVRDVSMLRIGVIGYGYWGPNIVRNFSSVDGARVVAVSDLRDDSLKKVEKAHQGVRTTKSADELILATDIDAVAIVTPVFTHFDLAKKALEAGKHVFVEKPFTYTVAQAEELINLAEKKNLKIMVDHTFLFTGSVRKMKQLVDDGTLGEIYYYDSMRVNLGLFQHDVNVIWDLAPHDLAIMLYVLGQKPKAVVATGSAHVKPGMEDMAYLTFYFDDNVIAHINVNWLSPVKVRTTLVGGQKKMLVWNDIEPDEKIKIYDKGVEVKNSTGVYNLLVSYRSGDMWAPKVDQIEALKLEAQYFVECCGNGAKPINDGAAGLEVVRMLEGSIRSLQNRGGMVEL
jgi:predicted dehydrogenase